MLHRKAARRRVIADYLHHEIGVHLRFRGWIKRWKFDRANRGAVVGRRQADPLGRAIVVKGKCRRRGISDPEIGRRIAGAPGLSVTRLSNSTTALLLASRPVTTRRTSAVEPIEHASRTMARDQNALRIIASSHFLWNAVDLTAWVRGQQDIDDNRGWLGRVLISFDRVGPCRVAGRCSRTSPAGGRAVHSIRNGHHSASERWPRADYPPYCAPLACYHFTGPRIARPERFENPRAAGGGKDQLWVQGANQYLSRRVLQDGCSIS